jgi:hypothetical protein
MGLIGLSVTVAYLDRLPVAGNRLNNLILCATQASESLLYGKERDT